MNSLQEDLERSQAANASLQSALFVLSADKTITGGARNLIEKEIELIKSKACGHYLFSELRTLREAVDHIKEELAYVKLQRDALLDITWLDLPADPCESTARWRELFNAGWVRRAETASDPKGAPSVSPGNVKGAPTGVSGEAESGAEAKSVLAQRWTVEEHDPPKIGTWLVDGKGKRITYSQFRANNIKIRDAHNASVLAQEAGETESLGGKEP